MADGWSFGLRINIMFAEVRCVTVSGSLLSHKRPTTNGNEIDESLFLYLALMVCETKRTEAVTKLKLLVILFYLQ